jgi:hypothetical protein
MALSLETDVVMDSPMLRDGPQSALMDRLASFSAFPKSQVLKVRAKDLAEDGLYFTGVGTKIVCCGCKFTFCLSRDQDPRICHWLSSHKYCSVADKLALKKYFSNEDNRLLTYPEDWESRCCFTGRQLAKAGFCYDGTGDQVWCFSCNISLSCWNPSDDPLEEHREHCGFTKMLAFGGREFPGSSGYQSLESPNSSEDAKLKSDDIPTMPPNDS